MRKEVVLITGANGEIGHGLISHMANNKNINVIALDVQPLDEELKPHCILLPYSGRFDMADHSIGILREVIPQTVILHHFDDFYPHFSIEIPMASFIRQVREHFPNVQVMVPEPLEDIELRGER